MDKATKQQISSFGARVKAIREELDMSQTRMSQTLNMSSSYLSAIEKGNSKPGISFCIKISEIYKVDLNFLYHGIGSMFLTGTAGKKEKKKKAPLKPGYVKDIVTREELSNIMDLSPMFTNAVLAFAANYLSVHEDTIRINIKRFAEKKPD